MKQDAVEMLKVECKDKRIVDSKVKLYLMKAVAVHKVSAMQAVKVLQEAAETCGISSDLYHF